MKKTAALALTLLLMTGSAYAYENAAAGYSVKTKNPLVTVESQKFYGFTDVASNKIDAIKDEDAVAMHIVNHFDADEMEKIIGEKFSTAYFNEQYEKLALLERSELNIKTLPIPLMDFDKYETYQGSSNLVLENYYLKQLVGDIERHISIDKFGKNKGITSTCYLKQAYNLTIAKTTVVSANDKLYMLTTTESHPGYFLPPELKQAQKTEEAADVDDTVDLGIIGGEDGPTEIYVEDYPMEPDTDYADGSDVVEDEVDSSMNPLKTVGDVKKLFKVENLNPADIDPAIIKAFDKKHQKFAKSVKLTEPVGEAKQLSYYEDAYKKDIVLPNDWFYAQTRATSKDMDFNFTMSTSVPQMQKVASSIDAKALMDIFLYLDDATLLSNAQAEVGDKAAGLMMDNVHAALSNCGSLLLTGSFTSKDPAFKQELANIYVTPEESELTAMMLLDDTFSRLDGFANGYIALEDYAYDVRVGTNKAKLDMDVGIGVFGDLHFMNNLRMATNKDSATFLWLLSNKRFKVEPEIIRVVDQWQF